jgi:RimJ/RimL family protein N-acetyltransferase
MANPMDALVATQEALRNGASFDPPELDDEGYAKVYDEPFSGGKRYSYIKVISGEVQAVAIFGLDDPLDGVECYSVGYAVSENHRGRGLAVEAVNKGIANLIQRFSLTSMKRFYVEAVVSVTNSHSIKVAEKLFPGSRENIIERCTGEPALHFKRLVVLR